MQNNISKLYDETNPVSIEMYSQGLIDKSFKEVLTSFFADNEDLLNEAISYYNNPKGKGSLGNLIEEYFFFYKPNSDSEADFKEAGVELKVTPIKRLKSKEEKYSAAERLVLSMIPNNEPIPEELEDSHLISKLALMLLVIYLREEDKERIDYRIKYSKLFSITASICEEDFEIIKEDYRKISSKIRAGKADQLSEADTMYLGACTKGSTAAKSLQSQYYNQKIKAKRRAYSLKPRFMTYILNKYIIQDIDTYESIVKNPEVLKKMNFEEYVLLRLNDYIGKTEKELLEMFDINSKSKAKYSQIAFNMLGVKSNRAEEFVKAGIQIKAIRLEKNNKMTESISFPEFVVKELTEEEWEESQLYNIFSETKFLYIVFKNQNGEYMFKGAQFWNMPIEDLEGDGYEEWLTYQEKFKNGVNFNIVKNGSNTIVYNDLPKMTQTEIFHVRPHTSQSAHVIDNIHYGKGTIKNNTDELLNGDRICKQSFWLNNKYIIKQLDDKFFE